MENDIYYDINFFFIVFGIIGLILMLVFVGIWLLEGLRGQMNTNADITFMSETEKAELKYRQRFMPMPTCIICGDIVKTEKVYKRHMKDKHNEG